MVISFLHPFLDELSKIAAKIPVIHGTSGQWDVLKPGVGPSILPNDPNPRAVYVAPDSRRLHRSIADFARKATAARGGTPTIAHSKIDTTKGWIPRQLSAYGKQHIGDIDDALDLVDELDSGVKGTRRGEIWKLLNKGVGSWKNVDPATTLRPTHYTILKSVAKKFKVG